MSLNQENADKCFDVYKKTIDKYHFLPHGIYNITTVQGKPSKIIAKTGGRQVGELVSAEHGQLVTVKLCMSVRDTSVLPPLFIFPRVKIKNELLIGAPPEPNSARHKSCWMQLDIFDWFKHRNRSKEGKPYSFYF